MTLTQPRPGSDPAPGLHVATIAHLGLLWDTYLELDDDPLRPNSFRGRLRFHRAGGSGQPEMTRTTVIIIEESYEEAVEKARSFDDRQLEGLLRSTLPDAG